MSGFEIDFDPATGIMEARVAGFWEPETMAGFVAQFTAMLASLRARGEPFGVLGNASQFAVQGQGIADALTRLVDAGNQVNRAPTAVVVGGALLKMQATRSMSAPHLRVFLSRDEALAWLRAQLDKEGDPGGDPTHDPGDDAGVSAPPPTL